MNQISSRVIRRSIDCYLALSRNSYRLETENAVVTISTVKTYESCLCIKLKGHLFQVVGVKGFTCGKVVVVSGPHRNCHDALGVVFYYERCNIITALNIEQHVFATIPCVTYRVRGVLANKYFGIGVIPTDKGLNTREITFSISAEL